MVVGNGLIAKAFKDYQLDENVIIFASGVSNSQECIESEFNREFVLLQDAISKKKHLVYFSSTSVYDESTKNTPYVIHKINLEHYIENNAQSYTIFRLPIVVGNTDNETALLKLIYNQITHEKTIQVFSKACRYFLDVDDLAYLVKQILQTGVYKNDVVDMCISPSLPINDVISIMETAVGKASHRYVLDKGGCYCVDTTKIDRFLKQISFIVDADYNKRVITKYYK